MVPPPVVPPLLDPGGGPVEDPVGADSPEDGAVGTAPTPVDDGDLTVGPQAAAISAHAARMERAAFLVRRVIRPCPPFRSAGSRRGSSPLNSPAQTSHPAHRVAE